MSLTTLIFDTKQIVYSDDKRRPIVGPDAPDGSEEFTAWKWDERIWTHTDYENTDLSLAVLDIGAARKISKDYFQSGVGNKDLDLKVIKQIKLYQNGIAKWSAKVNPGTYYHNKEQRYLFPDRSRIEYVDITDNVNTRNTITLAKTPKQGGQIIGRIWSRDSEGNIQTFTYIRKRLQFTGLYDSQGMKSTEDADGNILWSNVDTARPEFVVDWTNAPPTLYFNKDYTQLVGPSSVSSDDQMELCEYLGETSGESSQIFTTKLFPILNNAELVLYAGDYTTTLTKDTDYSIDLDRGEIGFLTTPPAAGTKMYLRYRATVEVEYEPEYCDNYRTAFEMEMNPMRSSVARGIIHLTEKDRQVAYITLESDADTISQGIYGPLIAGSGYSVLTATAYNVHDQVIPNVLITFYLDETDLGTLNGSNGNVSIYTDSNGQATVVYVTPRTTEALGQYVLHSLPDPANQLKLAHTAGINADTVNSIYTYAVYNNDTGNPWYAVPADGEPGRGGAKFVIYKWSPTAIHPVNNVPGAYAPVRPTGINVSGSDTYLTYDDPLAYITGSHVAFWIVGTRHAVPHAKTYSYLYGQYITEKEGIELRVELPEYMKGSYQSGSIEKPYGTRLPDDNSVIASAVSGAIYLSINS